MRSLGMSGDYRIPDLDQKVVDGVHDAAVPGVVSAYLFGSHARGTPHRESDVDVGVLLDRASYADAGARFDARVRLSSALGVAVRRDVDVVILNDAPPLLGRHIIREGRRVFCADHVKDHDYVVHVMIRAADVEPWYRRYARLKLAAIRR